MELSSKSSCAKVREIKKATGINVPFPEDSRGVIDAITRSLLLDTSRKVSATKRDVQLEIEFENHPEADKIDIEVTDKFKRSSEFLKASRSVFTQHGIKAEEIEQDLKDNDEAIGTVEHVETFVLDALERYGSQIDKKNDGWIIHRTNLPEPAARELPGKHSADKVPISFESPTPTGFHYIGRNHPFVEQLCQLVLAKTDRQRSALAHRGRLSFVLTQSKRKPPSSFFAFAMSSRTARKKSAQQIVAEEMMLWGFRGDHAEQNHLTPAEASDLLASAKPSADLDDSRRARMVDETIEELPKLKSDFDTFAESRSQHLVDAHQRFSKLLKEAEFKVVYPVLPMDIIGLYILLPA